MPLQGSEYSKGNEDKHFTGCKAEKTLITGSSDKSLSRACPQIEDSLFAQFASWPNKCFMTSLYEHSQPEGGNAKLICILKLLSQAGLLLELHWLCICVIQQALLKHHSTWKDTHQLHFLFTQFLLFLPSHPADQLLYSHFNSPLGSWIAIDVFRKEDASPYAPQSIIFRIQGKHLNLEIKHTVVGIPASSFICYVDLGKLLYFSGPHIGILKWDYKGR